MFRTLFERLALLATKFNVVAPACVVPSNCRVRGVWVELMVDPAIEIPVPAVNVFCLAAGTVFMTAVVEKDPSVVVRNVLET